MPLVPRTLPETEWAISSEGSSDPPHRARACPPLDLMRDRQKSLLPYSLSLEPRTCPQRHAFLACTVWERLPENKGLRPVWPLRSLSAWRLPGPKSLDHRAACEDSRSSSTSRRINRLGKEDSPAATARTTEGRRLGSVPFSR